MEGIFQSVGVDKLTAIAEENEAYSDYENEVAALIQDAVNYNDSDLSPEREEAIKYYEGKLPGLDDETDNAEIYGDPMIPDDELPNKSMAVTTDVRDTVLAIMPSLIRIFTSAERIAYFVPNYKEQVGLANQQSDYIEKIFWDDNEGFLLLHDVFKDALIQKIGVLKWRTDNSEEMRQRTFEGISILQAAQAIEEYTQANPEASKKPEIVDYTPSMTQEGYFKSVTIRYVESSPKHIVEAVPPEEFRIDRRARSVKSARLVGHAMLQTPSYLVSLGYDPEIVNQYRGTYAHYSPESDLRTPGIDTSLIRDDMVEYGEYFIRIDSDGDGIDELHRICTIGSNYTIVDDQIVDDVCMAVFCGDPRPHTVIGDSIADLTKDIQKINTQILRGSLDSLSASMYSDYVVNELTTSVEDVMTDGVGKIIRTRGDPMNSVHEFKKSFIGDAAFTMMATMDGIRQRRTGISEASKGVDPKALQSTNQIGVEAIVNGAQERIELIARIFAETGFKQTWQGLLREVCRAPNKAKTIQIRGEWVEMNPSLFDPNLSVKVNPTMGKGSDTTRLMALQTIKEDQKMIMAQFGIGNTMVTPQHYMNTMADMMSIANIKDMNRYYNPMTPEQLKAIQEAPKEPSAEDKIAMAELEKVRSQTAKNVADAGLTEQKMKLEDDFRRDKLTLDTFAKLAPALAKVDLETLKLAMPVIEGENQVD